jgi:hypothetical protein
VEGRGRKIDVERSKVDMNFSPLSCNGKSMKRNNIKLTPFAILDLSATFTIPIKVSANGGAFKKCIALMRTLYHPLKKTNSK